MLPWCFLTAVETKRGHKCCQRFAPHKCHRVGHALQVHSQGGSSSAEQETSTCPSPWGLCRHSRGLGVSGCGMASLPITAPPTVLDFHQKAEVMCLFSMLMLLCVFGWKQPALKVKIYPNTSIESNRPIYKVVLCCHKIINHCWTIERDCLSGKLFPRYFGSQISCHNTSKNKSVRVKKEIYFWVEVCHCLLP